MNQQRIDKIIDNLSAMAGGLAQNPENDLDAEVLLDAIELIRGLVIEQINNEAIMTNQRAEIQRMRSNEGIY